MKKIAAFIVAFVFCSSLASSQEIAPKTRVEAMFNSFKPGEIELAIETFAKGSLIEPEMVDSVQSQAKQELSLDNPILAFEFIQEVDVGKSIKRLTYILKTKDEPFIWNFSFYQPTTAWVPLRMGFVQEF